MACIDFPLPTLPTLSGGLTLGASLSLDLSSDVDFCCKIVPIPSFTISLPLPPGTFSDPVTGVSFAPAVLATLNAAISAVNAYHDALSFDCPME